MPTYDTYCSVCKVYHSVQIKIEAVEQWDQNAHCPHCGIDRVAYTRVIRRAPALGKVADSQSYRRAAKQSTAAEKDDMRHKALKRHEPDQIAHAVEAVRKGTYEGF